MMDARSAVITHEIKQLKWQVKNLIESVNEIDKELQKLKEDK
tara:strand:+ start:292 stop:417 length:126 start_codon:yes stop_codon:yes gene_type:complete